MMEPHIAACLHSLGKDQPWLEGIQDEFVAPGEKGVCHTECKKFLSDLETDYRCCAPHIAAQHFAHACPKQFQGSCMHFTTAEADAAVAELSEVCEFAPAQCPACGDALVFVVPAPHE